MFEVTRNTSAGALQADWNAKDRLHGRPAARPIRLGQWAMAIGQYGGVVAEWSLRVSVEFYL